jgi:hypothetical protein
MVLAGLLGSASQAALGIADQIIFSNMLVMNGFCAGVSALLSQAHGAGNYALADLYVKHSQLGSAIVGILATIIGYSTAGAIAQAFAGDPAVRQQAALFIQLCALGNLPWALVLCQGAIFRASGLATLGIVQWIIVTFLCIGGERKILGAPGNMLGCCNLRRMPSGCPLLERVFDVVTNRQFVAIVVARSIIVCRKVIAFRRVIACQRGVPKTVCGNAFAVNLH